MAPKVGTSIKLQSDLLSRLDAYADAAERSRSWVVGKALEQFLPNSAGSSSAAGPGSVGECPAEKNPDGQRADESPPRLANPLTDACAPSASVRRFHAEHARRHLETQIAHDKARTDAVSAALAQARREIKQTDNR